ncbi:hypothetical protein TthSNM11_09020 [Thermus thermophilus]|uniref:hypothetical protein n=1 Tax=Thermus thermophilus TaxID=274 RepID=UPI001FCD96EA|nr:hypothetical protein [Thermus thermophilus]BDG18699.1 hypothetical protein TthSNM11_09020 [Thermus thermophilus]
MTRVAQAQAKQAAQEEAVVVALSPLEARALLNILRGEAEWGELPEALEALYRTLRAWERTRRTA